MWNLFEADGVRFRSLAFLGFKIARNVGGGRSEGNGHQYALQIGKCQSFRAVDRSILLK